MKDGIPYSYVFFKTEDIPGWAVAFITGSEEEIIQKIKQFSWFKYKIARGGTYYIPVEDVIPCIMDPEDTHMVSSYVYSCELKKWFFPDELIPIPQTEFSLGNIKYSLEYEEDLNEDLGEICDEENEFYSFVTVNIQSGEQKYGFTWEYSDLYVKDFQIFIKELTEKGFSFFEIEEYSYIKVLTWKMDNNVRVKIQDYSYHDDVKEPIDFMMDFEKFLTKAKSLLNLIHNEHDKFKLKFNRNIDTVGKMKY